MKLHKGGGKAFLGNMEGGTHSTPATARTSGETFRTKKAHMLGDTIMPGLFQRPSGQRPGPLLVEKLGRVKWRKGTFSKKRLMAPGTGNRGSGTWENSELAGGGVHAINLPEELIVTFKGGPKVWNVPEVVGNPGTQKEPISAGHKGKRGSRQKMLLGRPQKRRAKPRGRGGSTEQKSPRCGE